jgi:hypothetical protein
VRVGQSWRGPGPVNEESGENEAIEEENGLTSSSMLVWMHLIDRPTMDGWDGGESQSSTLTFEYGKQAMFSYTVRPWSFPTYSPSFLLSASLSSMDIYLSSAPRPYSCHNLQAMLSCLHELASLSPGESYWLMLWCSGTTSVK